MTINERIEVIIKNFELTPSAFADAIGIQRPSLSHILSGRNKASLDVVQKVLDTYQNINPMWLINGEGKMINEEIKEISPDEKLLTEYKNKNKEITNVNNQKTTIIEQNIVDDNEKLHPIIDDEEIEKIVIFYKDKTFKILNPR
jgi:plasmid maintenance system antidote protein VapI